MERYLCGWFFQTYKYALEALKSSILPLSCGIRFNIEIVSELFVRWMMGRPSSYGIVGFCTGTYRSGIAFCELLPRAFEALAICHRCLRPSALIIRQMSFFFKRFALDVL